MVNQIFQVTPSVVKDSGCFIYYEPSKETIKIAKLTSAYRFPNLGASNSISKGLIGTQDKKTNVCSDESPFQVQFQRISTSQARSYEAETKMTIIHLCLEEIEQDLSREISNISIEELKEEDIEKHHICLLIVVNTRCTGESGCK